MGRLNAGQLQERVALLTTAAAAKDGRGGYVPTGPATEKLLHARVRPLRGTEQLALGQILNSIAYEITIRSYKGFERTAKQRVRWKAETLDVQVVVYDENREYVVLTCFNRG